MTDGDGRATAGGRTGTPVWVPPETETLGVPMLYDYDTQTVRENKRQKKGKWNTECMQVQSDNTTSIQNIFGPFLCRKSMERREVYREGYYIHYVYQWVSKVELLHHDQSCKYLKSSPHNIQGRSQSWWHGSSNTGRGKRERNRIFQPSWRGSLEAPGQRQDTNSPATCKVYAKRWSPRLRHVGCIEIDEVKLKIFSILQQQRQCLICPSHSTFLEFPVVSREQQVHTETNITSKLRSLFKFHSRKLNSFSSTIMFCYTFSSSGSISSIFCCMLAIDRVNLWTGERWRLCNTWTWISGMHGTWSNVWAHVVLMTEWCAGQTRES